MLILIESGILFHIWGRTKHRMGPCGLLWDRMGPYETVWALMGPYGLLLNRMGTYGNVELNTVWDRMGQYDRMGTLTQTLTQT